jgi:hypothetical protein
MRDTLAEKPVPTLVIPYCLEPSLTFTGTKLLDDQGLALVRPVEARTSTAAVDHERSRRVMSPVSASIASVTSTISFIAGST